MLVIPHSATPPPKAIMVGFPPISQSKLDGNLTGNISLLPCSFWQLGCLFQSQPQIPAVPAPSRIRDSPSLPHEPGGQVGSNCPRCTAVRFSSCQDLYDPLNQRSIHKESSEDQSQTALSGAAQGRPGPQAAMSQAD